MNKHLIRNRLGLGTILMVALAFSSRASQGTSLVNSKSIAMDTVPKKHTAPTSSSDSSWRKSNYGKTSDTSWSKKGGKNKRIATWKKGGDSTPRKITVQGRRKMDSVRSTAPMEPNQ